MRARLTGNDLIDVFVFFKAVANNKSCCILYINILELYLLRDTKWLFLFLFKKNIFNKKRRWNSFSWNGLRNHLYASSSLNFRLTVGEERGRRMPFTLFERFFPLFLDVRDCCWKCNPTPSASAQPHYPPIPYCAAKKIIRNLKISLDSKKDILEIVFLFLVWQKMNLKYKLFHQKLLGSILFFQTFYQKKKIEDNKSNVFCRKKGDTLRSKKKSNFEIGNRFVLTALFLFWWGPKISTSAVPDGRIQKKKRKKKRDILCVEDEPHWGVYLSKWAEARNFSMPHHLRRPKVGASHLRPMLGSPFSNSFFLLLFFPFGMPLKRVITSRAYFRSDTLGSAEVCEVCEPHRYILHILSISTQQWMPNLYMARVLQGSSWSSRPNNVPSSWHAAYFLIADPAHRRNVLRVLFRPLFSRSCQYKTDESRL